MTLKALAAPQIALVLTLWMSAWAGVHAANPDSTPGDEYEKKIHAAEQVSPLGSDFTGEQVSLYDGSTSFSVTDVDLPGNNALPVRIARHFKVEDRHGKGYLPGFGDWEIDIPRIHGVFLADRGWKLQGTSPYARCTSQALPDVSGIYAVIGPRDVWSGTSISLPGEGDQEFLINDQPKLPAITDGQTYPWVTAGLTRVRCLSATANGYPGEAFVATGTNGTQYTFDYVVTNPTHAVQVPTGNNKGQVSIARVDVSLLLTRMQDRFGNWVVYDYSGSNLVGIRASDGRALTVAWNTSGTQIQSVSANGRTWTYGYTAVTGYAYTASLNQVTQPDGSAWTYSAVGALKPIREAPLDGGADYLICPVESDARYDSTGYHLTVGHPSGASVVYDFSYDRTYRSHTPIKGCRLPIGQQAPIPYAANYWDSYQLDAKTTSGPGIASQRTTYARDGVNSQQFYTTGTATDPCTTCQQSKLVTVTGPDGGYQRYTFGVMYGLNDGKLLQVDRGLGTAAPLTTSTTQFMTTAEVPSQPFPDAVGSSRNLVYSFDNRLRPVKQAVVTEDGATFSSISNSFDAFGRALNVTKSSSTGVTKTDVTGYYDDSTKWVLGQVASLTDVKTGLQISQTDYWPVTALPQRTWSFGLAQQYMTYATDGTLATVVDARNNTTTLSNWKRGVPQTILFAATPESPAGATQSAIVDDNGWIKTVTDANGYITGYGYDLMGRMASIAYPTSDTTVWNATTQNFKQLTAAENGFPAGHWRQLLQTGNGVKLTYFDALLRPLVTDVYDAADVNGTLSQTVMRYDTGGHLAFKSYPTTYNTNYAAITQGIRTTYDGLDRPLRVEQDSELGVLASTTQYLTGFKVLKTNPRLQSTRISYQAYDQPNYDMPNGFLTPEGEATEIYHNVFGEPTFLRRRNADASIDVRHSYVYDANQRLCKTTEPETGATVMGYDAAGNLIWSAAGTGLMDATQCNTNEGYASGRRVDRTYDNRNRLTDLVFPDSNGNQHWTYTADSKPAQVTTLNDAGSTTVVNAYTYNKRRLLTGESISQPGWYTWSSGNGFDANANLSTLTYPAGLSVDYAPNALGQATRAGTYATGVTYYPNGGIHQFTYGNGVVHTMTQNVRQLPTRSRDAFGTTAVLDDSYDYDANGNVAAISDGLTGARGNRTMGYDGLDRLISTTSPMYGTAGAHYTYDVLDNLKTVQAPGRDQTYVYDPSNRLTNVTNTVGGASVIGLGYDAQGNLANKSGQTFTFDYGNRLRVATSKENYRYDAAGRRVLAASPTLGNILSQYNQAGQLLYQQNARTSNNYEYVYLGGSLVALRELPFAGGVNVKYQHTDALGSPVAVTDASKTVTERSEYEPFGALLNRTAHDGPGYTGHVSDAATGLSYMQQRYYDPGIGRFLSVDPVTADGNTGNNFNRYKYANNNPYRFTDPDGRQSMDEIEEPDPAGTTRGSFRNDLARINPAAEPLETLAPMPGCRNDLEPTPIDISPNSSSSDKLTFTTYTREKPDGTRYSGRTRGTDSPERQVSRRTSSPDHQERTRQGYGPGKVDKNTPNYNAARGQEQHLIKNSGGAQSQGGTSGNKVNGVSESNPQKTQFEEARQKEIEDKGN